MGIYYAPTLTCRDCGAVLPLSAFYDRRRAPRLSIEHRVSDRGTVVIDSAIPGACSECGGGRVRLDTHDD